MRGLLYRATHGAGALFMVLLGSTDARAEEEGVQDCIRAAEHAQELRDAGHYSNARKELFVCARPTCPTAVQQDCTVWLVELDRATPTIVLRSRRSDARSVRVLVDGEPFLEQLDGQPKPIDPGEHVFRFEIEGGPPTEQTLMIFASERGRVIDVPSREEPEVPEEPPAETQAPADPHPPEAVPEESTEAPAAASTTTNGTRTLAYVLGGAGIVGLGIGIGFGLKAQSTYESASSPARCPTGPTSCDELGIAGGRDAHAQAAVATVATIAGGTLLAGGLVLFFVSNKSPAVNLQTAALPGGALLRGTVPW